MLGNVLKDFGFNAAGVSVILVGSGRTNHTWKVETGTGNYILQRINHKLFRDPWAISHNNSFIADYLLAHAPAYKFVHPIKTIDGKLLSFQVTSGSCYRMMPFVEDAYTINFASTTAEAFEAAKQFGKLSYLLRGLSTDELKLTIPSYHDLELRYQQFKSALEKGNPLRVREAREITRQVEANAGIVDRYRDFIRSPLARKRVTHHDTRISNVLFDKEGKGICIIDTDTLMPGYFISDAGNMLRTYLSPVSEEEKDYSKIEIRKEYLDAVATGYLSEMRDELSAFELRHFLFSGCFLTYLYAIRFLTDYLLDDIYFGSKYERHNLVRAGNQMVLLQKLLELDNGDWERDGEW